MLNTIAFATLGRAAVCTGCRRIFVAKQWQEAEPAAAGESAVGQPFAAAAADLVVPGLDLHLVFLPAGEFVLGNAMGAANERPEHRVVLTTGFYLGSCLVTQAQYRLLVGESPSYFVGDEHPVETVSWHQALEFCRRLSERERVAGRLPANAFFRLPTEAEWEYACRVGEQSDGGLPTATGETVALDDAVTLGSLAARAWFHGNSAGTTHPVAGKLPTGHGLYDLLGNVAEWCHDWYGMYGSGAETDPAGPAEGRRKVRRGGGWSSVAPRCRASDRAGVLPDCQCALLGFRVALVAQGPCPYAGGQELVV